MKFVKETLKFNLYGTDCVLNFPTLKEMQTVSAAMAKEDASELDVTKDFLVSLGLKEELFEELQANHITQIMESLTGK